MVVCSLTSIAGTKMTADPEKCSMNLFLKITDLLWDRTCLELSFVFNSFQALLFWQDKVESVLMLLIPIKKCLKLLGPRFPELIQ